MSEATVPPTEPHPLHTLITKRYLNYSIQITLAFQANVIFGMPVKFKLFSHLLPKLRTYFYVSFAEGTAWIFLTPML